MPRKTDGFTLVELMVVVLIIGILVAVAVPVFRTAQAQAAKNACQATQRTIRGAIEAYWAANPDAPQLTTVNYNYHFPNSNSPWCSRLMPNYIKSVGLCNGPKSAAPFGRTYAACYAYQVTAEGVVGGCLWRMDNGSTDIRWEHVLP